MTVRFVTTAGSVMVMGGALMLGCGGSDSPTTPAAPKVTSCSTVEFRSNTYKAQCAIPGQSQQPAGLTLTSGVVCLKVTCSSGCASAVSVC